MTVLYHLSDITIIFPIMRHNQQKFIIKKKKTAKVPEKGKKKNHRTGTQGKEYTNLKLTVNLSLS